MNKEEQNTQLDFRRFYESPRFSVVETKCESFLSGTSPFDGDNEGAGDGGDVDD